MKKISKQSVNSYKNKAHVPQIVYDAMREWERQGDEGNEAAYFKTDRVTALLPVIVNGSGKCRRRVGRIVRVVNRLQAS